MIGRDLVSFNAKIIARPIAPQPITSGVSAGDLTFDIANQALEEGRADLFVFGRAYVSNPDLVARFAANAKLAEPSMMTLYGGGAPGYTDYPTMA